MAKKKSVAATELDESALEGGGDDASDGNLPTFKDDARSKIYAKREEALSAEIGALEENNGEETLEDSKTQSIEDEVVAEGSENSLANPDTDQQEKNPQANGNKSQEKHRLVINGQSVDYTFDEVMQLAQRGAGAEKKFEEAALMRKQAHEMMYGQQHANSTGGQPPVNSQNQPGQLTDTLKQELGDIAKRLDFGTEEDRIQALFDAGQLFGKMTGSGNGPSPELLVDVATRNAINVLQMQSEQDILKNEFKDIVADPALAQATDFLANQIAHKYASLGQQKTRLEILREAGNAARERYLPVNAQASPQQNSSIQTATNIVPMNDKIERKRMAPQPPAAANAVAKANPKAQPDVSPSAVVAAMRQARGQA